MFADVVAEVGGRDVTSLLDRLVALEERRRRDEAEQAAVLAELDRRRAFSIDGHATMWGLLRSLVGWSDGECRTRMRTARLVAEFAEAGDLLDHGRAPVANIAEIARAHANPRCGHEIEQVVGTLFTEACRLEHDDLKRLVRQWEQLADVDGAHRDRAAHHAARTAQLAVWDGVGHLVAQWGEADALLNREIFEQYVQAEWHTDWELTVARHGDDACTALMPRSDAQRRADALTRIFADAASAPPGSTGPATVVNIHVDHDTFTDLLTSTELFPDHVRDPFEDRVPLVTDRRCCTMDGHVVDPDHAVRSMLEGYVRFVIHDEGGVPIRWGRRRRLFTGAARDAVMSLSPRCTHPGCRVRASRSEADHTVEHARGGGTDPDNGGPRCRRHNQMKNRGYTVHRDRSGRWHTYRPDGSEIP
jgi:hypothetical protein